ncbi:hypothetical protein AKJ57_05970 [candidate division MSBL1 archaeon SCGC-AAA259A05]|uniref:Carbohydrate kinase PfkB domain-containing protein n=1 Tax=candidate division MSBL1 archaeon SCGC-AAA259A05 TaxID=1698259 RepID=A0A133U480_9EURY|nr:hypothetical protein AKJ57_05970 [candidate division MSBL1 archaeon SCGC-AAA259A05]
MQLDTVVVGHATVDVNVLPHGVIENVLGGAPTYAGFALASLGREVGIVSKIGQDFPDYFPPLFSKFGLNTEGILVTRGGTTKFENTYTEKGEREQVCEEVADPIVPGDIPQAYLNSRSFYFSPVMDEVSPKTLSRISDEENVAMIDPQGLFRRIEDSGEIRLEVPKNFEDYLSQVEIVKIGKDEFRAFGRSEEEVLESLSGMGPDVAILTLGEDGCKVFSDGKVTNIKSLSVEAKDLTGAGDVFGASFLSNYLETGDPTDSARFATAAAGLKIEYKGPTGFPSKEEVKEML